MSDSVPTFDDWQSGSSIQKCNELMFEKQLGCDVMVIITTSKKTIGAHRYILISRSAVFFNLLVHISPRSDIPLEFENCTTEAAIAFLRFLYTDIPALQPDTVMGVLALCKQYGVRNLEVECVKYMKTQITTLNVCEYLIEATRYQQDDLYVYCLGHILDNGEAVIKGEGFRVLSLRHVDDVISQDNLNAEEQTVYYGVMKWAMAEAGRHSIEASEDNLRNILGTTLFKIRFPLLRLGFFSSVIAKQKLLTDSEKVILFRYFTKADDEVTPFNRTRRQAIVKRSNNVSVSTVTRFSNTVGPLKIDLHHIDDAIRAFAVTFTSSMNILLKGFLLYQGSKARYDIKINLYSGDASHLHEETQTLFSTEGTGSNVTRVTLARAITVNRQAACTIAVQSTSPSMFYGVQGQLFVKFGTAAFTFIDAPIPGYSSSCTQGDLPGLLFSTL